ncbi:PirG, partial [Mycobacterium conspicuum]|uniref:PirG n=1 Tax=Mycobacterium conspicuum TaxID=44010 RepID=UPI0021F2E510
MPNRRRRKLSTAMSAVAALAVASPCAYFLVYESTESNKPPQHHEFKQAAVITDLPGELMGALTQGLSQFGINLPPVPALSGTSGASTGLTSPGLGSPGLGSPSLGTPGLGTTGLTGTGLTSPSLASPGPTTPGLGATTGLTPAATGATGGLTTPGTALTPTLPTTPGAAAATPNPALTSPAGVAPGTGAGMGSPIAAPSEVPIADPGVDGTYPILGDPSGLGGAGLSPAPAASSSGGGGLINDLMQTANQLGASQAIDLLKGLIMPAIMQAQHGGAAAAAPGAALPTGGLPGAAGLPAAAGAAGA